MRVLAPLAALAAAAQLAACGAGEPASSGLNVVATTTQAADLVRNVGGADVSVHQILAPNTDPHEYELRPGDVKAVAHADLVVRSGGDVDAWLTDAIKASGTTAPELTLSDRVPRAGDDPHWW